jgi:electron transfer flavoprotein alpha subunit
MEATVPETKRIWVLIEQENGQPHPVSWELLGAAQRLAAELPGCVVEGVLLGHDVGHIPHEAFRYGATRVYVMDDPVLAAYRNLPYAVGISALVKKYTPEIFLVGATTLGRDLASAIATRVGTGLTADCTELTIDPEKKILAATRPTFGGNLMATILCKQHRPQMATVRPRVLPLPQPKEAADGEVIAEPLGLTEDEVAVKLLRLIPNVGENVDLEYADVIVAGGRGLGGPEGFKLVEELATELGGVVGATRAAVDAGWIKAVHQIGQTGKTARPKLYIAAGISGAIQHRVGISGADFILAINTDPEAPIFQIANYGIVGDVYEVLPELIAQVKARNAARNAARQATTNGGVHA